MNDKVLSIAIMLVLVTIGINSFYALAGGFYDMEGDPIGSYDSEQFNSQYNQVHNADITISSGETGATSTQPSGEDSVQAFEINGGLGGLEAARTITNMTTGTQQILLSWEREYLFLSPIFWGIIFVISAIQIFVAGYFASVIVRAIFGRFQ